MKKKLIIAGVVLVVIVGGGYALIGVDISMKNPWLDGRTEPAKLGDLEIPVTAVGMVEASRLIEIKSKASGQVSQIHVVEGQMVKAGAVLVKLDPIDETRNVETGQANLDRVASALEKARISLANYENDLPLLTRLAQARLEDAEARLADAEYRYKKALEYRKKNVAAESEEVYAKTVHDTAKAQRDVAKTELERARNNEEIVVRVAQEDVKQAAAAELEARKRLDEWKLRLDETTVRAKSDGMVYSIKVREGEMIQSGTVSLMGGTALMFLADTSAMFVTAQVDEADIGSIRLIAPDYARPGRTQKLSEELYREHARRLIEGMEDRTVDVTVDAYRSETYKGVIERILPEPIRVNNALAFRVRVRLVGEDLQKLMGLQADLSFTTQKHENVVLVKNEALASEGRQCFVYVPVPGKPRDEEKRPVEIGMTDGTFTHIKSGVEAGDLVFIKRPHKTKKEQKESEKSG